MAAIADRQQKGTRILQAAIHVFAEKGFKSAALDEVARQAGTAKGTLYLYFRDKQELYFKAVLGVFDDLRSHIETCAARESGPVEKLRAIARGQLQYFALHRDAMRLVSGMLATSQAGLRKRLFSALLERRQEGIEALTRIMEEARRQRLVRGDIDTRSLVLSYMGLIGQAGQELMMQAGGGPDCHRAAEAPAPSPEEAASRADTMMRILMEGLAPRRP